MNFSKRAAALTITVFAVALAGCSVTTSLFDVSTIQISTNDSNPISAKTMELSLSDRMFGEISITTDAVVTLRPSKGKTIVVEADILILDKATTADPLYSPENTLLTHMVGSSKIFDKNGREAIHYTTTDTPIPFCKKSATSTLQSETSRTLTVNGKTRPKKIIHVDKRTLALNKGQSSCIWQITIDPGQTTRTDVIINNQRVHAFDMTNDEAEEFLRRLNDGQARVDFLSHFLGRNSQNLECTDFDILDEISSQSQFDVFESLYTVSKPPQVSMACAHRIMQVIPFEDELKVLERVVQNAQDQLNAEEFLWTLNELEQYERGEALRLIVEENKLMALLPSQVLPRILRVFEVHERPSQIAVLKPYFPTLETDDIHRILNMVERTHRADVRDMLF